MNFEDLPSTIRYRLIDICDAFEAAWSLGQRPRIEVYLKTCPEPERGVLFEMLLAIELDFRHEAGERPELKEYLDRFPKETKATEKIFRGGVAGQSTLGVEVSTTEFEPGGRLPDVASPTEFEPGGRLPVDASPTEFEPGGGLPDVASPTEFEPRGGLQGVPSPTELAPTELAPPECAQEPGGSNAPTVRRIGRYTILRELGKGNFLVYLARRAIRPPRGDQGRPPETTLPVGGG